jgi:peptidoglycan/LPS O-acetylase OafA/YrhL
MASKDKVYFEGLNGLRGIAALLVLFGHTTDLVFPNGTTYNPLWAFLSNNGDNAVSFFFVLSGFLISYLMLVEIQNHGNVHIGKFYLKRVFRIWPIYYFVILLVQVILPILMMWMGKDWKTVSNVSTFYYLIILPNIPYLFYDTGKLFHLWSIGVEEQFYLIWAPLVRFFKKYFLQLCVGVIAIKLILLLIFNHLSESSETMQSIYLILKQFRIEQMCVGGIGAYMIFHHKDKVLTSAMFNKIAQVVFFVILAFFLCMNLQDLEARFLGKIYHFVFKTMGFLTVPILFLYLLINVSLNPGSFFKLENRWFNFMGNISYGFYVYHFLCVLSASMLMNFTGLSKGSILFAVVFYALAILINTVISWLSFEYFEKRFLKMSKRLTGR